jgi:putative flavoprotein involved in K+ transport
MPSNPRPERLDTIVVGGGQAGLAAGYHLKQQGRRFAILEAGQRVGDAWRHRWDSLRLFTPARYNSLPGMAFPAPPKAFPGKDEMADYLEAYAARFQLPLRLNLTAERLWRHHDRYALDAGGHRLESDQVIVATGAVPHTPGVAAQLDPAIRQLHSSHYRHPSQLRDGGVLVVGAGNSGAEIALEVAPTRPTWLSGRDVGRIPLLTGRWYWWLIHQRLTVDTRAGRWLRDTKHRGGTPLVRVRPKDLASAGVQWVPKTQGVRDGKPTLQDGRVLEVANVVWCTGFVPDYHWIDLPQVVYGQGGWPVHHRGVAPDAPGLYFVGLPFQYSLTSALIGGVDRDAAYVVHHLVTHPAPAPTAAPPPPSAADAIRAR